MKKLRLLFLPITVFLLVGFAPLAPVLAQPNIQASLCTGADLKFSETPTSSCSSGNATGAINNIIHTIINLMSVLVGIIAVIMIIVGGLRYITSGGNDTGVTSAKNTILYAIIGLIIVALAQVLVRFTLSKITNS